MVKFFPFYFQISNFYCWYIEKKLSFCIDLVSFNLYLLICSRSLFVCLYIAYGFLTIIMLYANKMFYFFSFNLHFLCIFHVFALAVTSSIMLNRSDGQEDSCLISNQQKSSCPNIRGDLNVDIIFHQNEKLPFRSLLCQDFF